MLKSTNSKKDNSFDYQFWVDLIRVFAVFLVVCVHVSNQIAKQYGNISSSDWWFANVINSASHICVPLFFMLTGYLLLNKEEQLQNYFKKRFSKIFFPWLTWSIIYLTWAVWFHNEKISLLYAITALACDKVCYHFWFLYALMALYIIIPILRVFVRNALCIHIYYFLAAWFLFSSIIPFIEKIINISLHKEYHFANNLNIVFGYSGYLVIGSIVGNLKITSKIQQRAIFVFLTCVFITALLTSFYSTKENSYIDYFHSYLTPNVIIMSISAFMILKFIGELTIFKKTLMLIIKELSLSTFGVYLIHMIILDIVNSNMHSQLLSWGSIFIIPLKVITILTLSFLIIKIVRLMPFLNKIV